MKKIICMAAAGLLLGAGVASAASVAPKTLRSFGDEINEGFVWSIAGIAPVGFPPCVAAGAITVQGAAYLGALDVGGFPTGDRSNYIHDMSAIVVFDAQELKNAAVTGNYVLRLNNATNLGYASLLDVAVLPDRIVRNVLQGGNADGSGAPIPRGPFPAGFQRIHQAETSANGGTKVAQILVPFAPVVSSQSVPLSSGGGGGVLDVCLGPTGQVRIIDPGNNGDWATECVADGWRPTQIQLGGGSPFAEAVDAAIANNAPITTCRFSCSPVAAGRNHDCTTVINSPLALVISGNNGASEADRGGEIWTNGVLGGNNYMALGGADENPLANIDIDAF
jgi:hypothetical protein